MRKIYIIRHSRPVFWDIYSLFKIINNREVKKLISIYDDSDIVDKYLPKHKEYDDVKKCKIIYTSNLKRSKLTANLFEIDNQKESILLREAELPSHFLFNISLPSMVFLIVLRVVWFLGYTKNCEHINEFKDRIKKASTLINEQSKYHSSVCIIGHGFTNRYLIRELNKLGWTCKKRINSKYLGINELDKR